MRVLLVAPHRLDQLGFNNPPLGLMYLAGTLKAHDIDVQIADGYYLHWDGIRERLQSYQPDIVGITALTPSRKTAIGIAKWAKKYNKNIITVLGGVHPTIMWKQVMENYPSIDICVIGEGEFTLLDIAQGKPPAEIKGIVYRQNNQIVKNPDREKIADLDLIPFPAWDCVDITRYPPRSVEGIESFRGIDLTKEIRMPVIFSRGCIGHCTFCSTWWVWAGWRCRSPQNMADELEILHRQYGIRHFVFEDDIFSANMDAAKSLCDEIISRRLGIAWFATTRVDCVDEELLRKMEQAGCYAISYGIESGSKEILNQMGKEATVLQAENAIRMTKEAGLKALCLLIIGNVGETSETINETIGFLIKTNPDGLGSVGGLWVLPGTALYQRVKRAGLINDDFWLGDEPYMVYYGDHTGKEIKEYGLAILNRLKLWGNNPTLWRLRRAMITRYRRWMYPNTAQKMGG
ncbi:MAG: cobalamin B12-binding domain-containing protein [Chloroflexi bacterium]|nr:cobalamin B12-binding domain-containing protein [Chloroflexota bacterium]